MQKKQNKLGQRYSKLFIAAAVSGALSLGVANTAFAASSGEYAASSSASAFEPAAPAVSPGISMGAPAAWGASWGQAFVGLGGVTRTPSNSKLDGSLVGGIGAGDPNKYVGVEVDTAIISLNTGDGGFAHDGNFAVKIHRNLPYNSAVAIGAENIGRWGEAKNNPATYYASASKAFIMRPDHPSNMMPLFVTVGIGDGRFRSIKNQDEDNRGKIGPFAAVAWHFLPRVGVVVDYGAQIYNAGVSFVPMKKIPVTVTLGATDITAKKTGKLAFVGALGYVFNF